MKRTSRRSRTTRRPGRRCGSSRSHQRRDRRDVELAGLGQDDGAHAAISSGSRDSLASPSADAALRRAEGDALDGRPAPASTGRPSRRGRSPGAARPAGAAPRRARAGGRRRGRAPSPGCASAASSESACSSSRCWARSAERVRRQRSRARLRASSCRYGPSGPRRSSWPEPRQTRSKTSCTTSSASAASRRIANAARCTSAACSA